MIVDEFDDFIRSAPTHGVLACQMARSMMAPVWGNEKGYFPDHSTIHQLLVDSTGDRHSIKLPRAMVISFTNQKSPLRRVLR